MNYQLQGLSIHAEVHGTTEPGCSPGRRATAGSHAGFQANNHGVSNVDGQRSRLFASDLSECDLFLPDCFLEFAC
jgi:hypothetical protein